MATRCPPGVFCIEYITLCVVLILIIIVYFVFNTYSLNSTDFNTKHSTLDTSHNVIIEKPLFNPKPQYAYNNISDDILMNPYAPPLRMPSYNTTKYHQLGILTSTEKSDMIIPLMGKVINNKRDKWNYYTLHNTNTMIKLPVIYKSKSCTDERGCDSLYTGDVVMVQGYNSTFKVTLYDDKSMIYNPDI